MPGGLDKSAQFYGKGIEALFPEGSAPKTTVPFPRAGMHKKRAPYEEHLVHAAVSKSPPDLQDVDPRTLHATQPWVTRSGVEHYMQGDYERTGQTYADAHQAGNRFPVIYNRHNEATGTTESLILSGHHRATKALLRGEQLRSIVVSGGYGPWKD